MWKKLKTKIRNWYLAPKPGQEAVWQFTGSMLLTTIEQSQEAFFVQLAHQIKQFEKENNATALHLVNFVITFNFRKEKEVK